VIHHLFDGTPDTRGATKSHGTGQRQHFHERFDAAAQGLFE
jgi:hypothetical protein